MIKKYLSIIAFVFCAGILSAGAEQPPAQKYIIMFADFGKKPVPEGLIAALAKNPELRLTLACQRGFKLPEDARDLLKDKRLELALSFEDEPVLPLVFDTVISSPVPINFSWPDDVWNIVFREKEDVRQNTQVSADGIYLRSGIFSGDLIPGLEKLGIYWANFTDETNSNQGVFIKDGFLIINTRKKSFAGIDECWKWIDSRQEQFIVLDFDGETLLNAEFLDALARRLKENGGVKAATPEIVLAKLKDKVPELGVRTIDTDLSLWTRLPLIWYELGIARKAIENYKNSGSAKLETLEKLRAQIYKLYNYRLLEGLIKDNKKENEDEFQSGISSIYAGLGMPVDESIKKLPGITQVRLFSVELSTKALIITNSQSTRPVKNIKRFYVTADDKTTSFFVDMDTSAALGSLMVDIYIDINNQEGAGLTKLLPGINCFLEPSDAWEYAFRIENGKATFYRAGRFDPIQVKQFNMKQDWELEIPRSVLKGNAFAWGYQVITATKQEKADGYDINDFLARDDEIRRKLLGMSAAQLPAIRVQTHIQDKQGN